MDGHIRYESRSDYANVALYCFDVFILIYGINNGINDFHGFRQSQTALSAFWRDREPHGLIAHNARLRLIDRRHPLQTSEQMAKTDAWLYSAEQTAKIDTLLANRRTVFHSGRCRPHGT
jgi:hypothetical protein